MSPSHKEAAEAMIAGDDIRYGTVFRRMRNNRSTAEMRRDGVAGCLRTPKGGSARQILFIAGRGTYRVRLLTAREHARLMGADDCKMDCPLNQAIFGFGDAVEFDKSLMVEIPQHLQRLLKQQEPRRRIANRSFGPINRRMSQAKPSSVPIG